MSITQRILSFDELFKRTDGDKIIINDLNFYSLEDNRYMFKELYTVYDDVNMISVKPSCDCGKLCGLYNLEKLCSECGAVCKKSNEKLNPVIWLKAINDDLKFMNPIFWLMLSKCIDSRVDYLKWLSNSKYNPKGINIPIYIKNIKDLVLKGKRSYSDFIKNIDNILIFLSTVNKFKISKEKMRFLNEIRTLYNTDKDKIFSTYYPIVNKKILVMENTNKGKFTSIVLADAIDTVLMWIKKYNEIDTLSEIAKNNLTSNIVSNLADIYYKYFKIYITKKEGILRKHVYGSRTHFSFRFVIVSLSDKHDRREIHVPWIAGCTAFRPHILNKLVNKNKLSKLEAMEKLTRAIKKYDKDVYDAMCEIVDEAPGMGIPMIVNRNPSLKQGSSLLLYITKFKNNPLDYSVSISNLIIDLPNGDFDGDELNFTLLLDNMMEQEARTLRDFYSLPSMSKPYTISNFLNLNNPATFIISNYLSCNDLEDNSNDTIYERLINMNK